MEYVDLLGSDQPYSSYHPLSISPFARQYISVDNQNKINLLAVPTSSGAVNLGRYKRIQDILYDLAWTRISSHAISHHRKVLQWVIDWTKPTPKVGTYCLLGMLIHSQF